MISSRLDRAKAALDDAIRALDEALYEYPSDSAEVEEAQDAVARCEAQVERLEELVASAAKSMAARPRGDKGGN